jgi:hypothetical protein
LRGAPVRTSVGQPGILSFEELHSELAMRHDDAKIMELPQFEQILLWMSDEIKWRDLTIRGDFRGVAVAADSDSLTQEADIFSKFQRSRPPVIKDLRLKPDITSNANNQADIIRSILGSDRNFKQDNVRRDKNRVVCFLAGKSAIYGSIIKPHKSIGYQETSELLESTERDGEGYLRWFIIYDGTNDYSVGRIVRRLQVLEELRVMSFVERENITSAYNGLLQLGQDLTIAVAELTGKRNTKKLIYELEGIFKEFNDFSTSIRFDGKRSIIPEFMHCSGGLSYRIGRSKHYYDSFIMRMADLRIDRIKGFQPYDRFVYRNYYQLMQSIISIKERYELFGNRLDHAFTSYYSLGQLGAGRIQAASGVLALLISAVAFLLSIYALKLQMDSKLDDNVAGILRYLTDHDQNSAGRNTIQNSDPKH